MYYYCKYNIKDILQYDNNIQYSINLEMDYKKENKLKEVPAELWHIQEEDGTLPDKLTEDTLYEVHVMVEDGGEFDLSDTEKEIKIAVILGNK
mgnify:CR=1 FL=1